MVRQRSFFVLALLVAPALLAFAPTAEACSAAAVPCGRIYPQIYMRIADQAPVYDLASAAPLVLEAELEFKFDMMNEGYTVPSPNEPVVVSFEFPRKPKWAEIAVEPERITIPVHDPTFIQADPTAQPPSAWFVYTTTIQITATLTGQAILRDGFDYHKLLVFAKSSESGLYQSGYGIKEIRVAPEGALHESDVAGSRDVFTPSPLPAAAVQAGEATVAGVTVSVAPQGEAKFWEPTRFDVAVSPAFLGDLLVAMHDEWGNLVAQSPLLDASSGAATFTATLAKPGLHTATVTLIPYDGGAPTLTVPVDFQAGALDADGFEYLKAYAVASSETFILPIANSADPLAQFERDIPFFAFDTAQSVTASVTLVTPNLAEAGRSAGNIQFSVHDPEGNLLNQASVDPTVPSKSYRIGSLPMDGWYTLRLKGVGAPVLSGYDARVEVAYATPKQERNHADGVADATATVLGLGGRNVTLAADALQVWAPGDVTPVIDGADAARYSVTIYDEDGRLAYASGWRDAAASATFTPPVAGTYRAFVHAEPFAPATSFSPVVRAFTFGVGNDTLTTATTFEVADVFDLTLAPATPGVVGMFALPRANATGAADFAPEGVTLRFLDADGNDLGDTAPALSGEYVLAQVLASRQTAAASTTGSVAGTVAYAAPVTLGNAATDTPPGEDVSIPALPVALVLLVAGLAAVGVALVRR